MSDASFSHKQANVYFLCVGSRDYGNIYCVIVLLSPFFRWKVEVQGGEIYCQRSQRRQVRETRIG